MKEVEWEIKRQNTEKTPPPPLVLNATAFVLLSCSGYEGAMFPVDSWYWPCAWKSDLERKSSLQTVQVRARETVTEGGNTCVCLKMCTVHVSACLPILLVTSVWCDCTSVYMCGKVWWALATIAYTLQRARVSVCASKAKMKGRSPICCGVMTVLFGGRKGLVWEQLVPRPVTF